MPSVMGKTSLSAKLSMMLTMPKLYLLCLLGLRPLQMKRALDILSLPKGRQSGPLAPLSRFTWSRKASVVKNKASMNSIESESLTIIDICQCKQGLYASLDIIISTNQ